MKRGPNEAGLEELENLDGQGELKNARPISYADLIYFCINGDVEGVNDAIASLSIEQITQNDNIVFRWAVFNGHLAVVNHLLAFQAVQDNIAADNNIALAAAASNGHLAVVNRLLAFQAVQDNITANDNRALRAAAKNGHLAVVNCLLAFQAVRDNILAENNDDEFTALDYAAQDGHFAVVDRLLEIDRSNYKTILEAGLHGVYEAIGNRRVARGVAVKALQDWAPSESKAVLPPHLRNKILTFAFHDDLCGKTECNDVIQFKATEGHNTCPVISSLRQRFEKKKSPIDANGQDSAKNDNDVEGCEHDRKRKKKC